MHIDVAINTNKMLHTRGQQDVRDDRQGDYNIGVIRWSAYICNPSWIPSTPSDQSSIDILVTIT